MGDALAASRVTRDSVHRQAIEITDADLVNALIDKLGARILGYAVNRDKSTLSRWRNKATVPDDASQAMRVIYQIFRLLESVESDHTIRAWFIGMNPQLDDTSPTEAIRDGRYREVMGAARAFMAGG